MVPGIGDFEYVLVGFRSALTAEQKVADSVPVPDIYPWMPSV